MTQIKENDPETFAIIGAAMEVHRHLGHGFLESVYQESLALELTTRGIPFQREVELPVQYKGQLLTCTYRADFICYGHVVVELKALEALNSAHVSQLINYLKATGHHVGLLLNFGAPRLEHPRYVWGPPRDKNNL